MALQEENEALRADNEQLRTLIIERSMAREPLHGEQFYAKDFRELAADVETWVAKMDRSGGIHDLSADKENEIFKRLGEIGLRASSSAAFMEKNKSLFQRVYRTPRSRVHLKRHIVAVILYDKVFAPLVFGLPPDCAKTLARIMEAIEDDGIERTTTTWLIVQSRIWIES